MLSIGAIGWRGHATRMIQLVNVSSKDVHVMHTFHPDYVPPAIGGTSNMDDLMDCDGIMVLSPNATHVAYIDELLSMGYTRPILCEKPPATSVGQLEYLRRLSPSNVMFNLPLRHSRMTDELRKMLLHIGCPLFADVISTHGLAFKDGYAGSWRADVNRHPLGVVETVAIHYIDLLIMLFGSATLLNSMMRNVAGTGTACDTARLTLAHDMGAMSSIMVSYASPVCDRMTIFGADGIIELAGNELKLMGPRDTFDRTGSFITPPVIDSVRVFDPFIDGSRSVVDAFIFRAKYIVEDECAPDFKQSFDDALAACDIMLSCGDR